MEQSNNLQQLLKEKESIETELKEIKVKLTPLLKKKLDQNLVDSEGFPRQDLEWADLVEYRTLNKRNNELQNDLKALMKKLEQGLLQFHEQARNSGQADAEKKEIQQQRKQEDDRIRKQKEEEEKQKLKELQEKKKQQENSEKIITPFAEITEVTSGSPSYHAGIEVDDLIYNFGGVDFSNHNNLQSLVQKVKENINSPIEVLVLRKDTENKLGQEEKITWNNQKEYFSVNLKLIPQKWEGQGVIGCRFKPL